MIQDDSMMLAKQLVKSGWEHLNNQQTKSAVDVTIKLNKTYPNFCEGWYFTAKVAQVIGNKSATLKAYQIAMALEPSNNTLIIELAYYQFTQGSFELCHELIKPLLKNDKLSANEHNQIALLLSKLNLSSLSIEHYKLAIDKDPNNHEHLFSLATVQRHIGDLVSAESSLSKAIVLNPKDVDAHALRVDLRKQTRDRNYTSSLEALLKEKLSAKDFVQIHFALSKSYEDMSNFGRAFEYLEKGCQLRRQHLQYDVDTDVDIINQIIRHFDASWYADGGEEYSINENLEDELTPIFIVGMPRTGSTLTDRILCGAENVFSAGELNEFSQALTEIVQNQGILKSGDTKSFIKSAATIDFNQLGQNYLARVKARFANEFNSKGIQYFTDKLPFNYLYLGLIKKALPHAKIIHVTRNPMDTCYAVLKTLFLNAYPFSYDQRELGVYFSSYYQLMRHWQKDLQLDIHNVQYEELVQNPLNTSNAIYKYCGIPWLKEYADITKATGVVNTASASQVRQPIHKGSLNKWKEYEGQLHPLKEQLTRASIKCE